MSAEQIVTFVAKHGDVLRLFVAKVLVSAMVRFELKHLVSASIADLAAMAGALLGGIRPALPVVGGDVGFVIDLANGGKRELLGLGLASALAVICAIPLVVVARDERLSTTPAAPRKYARIGPLGNSKPAGQLQELIHSVFRTVVNLHDSSYTVNTPMEHLAYSNGA